MENRFDDRRTATAFLYEAQAKEQQKKREEPIWQRRNKVSQA